MHGHDGDEVYRSTLQDDGHWVTCDKYENPVGDNIQLVKDLEPGTGFADAVYRLSGAPSVSNALRRAPAPVPPRQAPEIPPQSAEHVETGRRYLQGRGIALGTIKQAEAAGMLRYSHNGVLFVGRDERGIVQNITRRAVTDQGHQKSDLLHSDKRHPQILMGSPDSLVIVEGGVDALATVDISRRQGTPQPTILVSGGAGVRSFIQTPWVQMLLQQAKRITVAFEREKTPEVQAKTDQAHELQMQRLQEVCTAQVTAWKPPEGIKDMAALNLHHAQEIDAREQTHQQRAQPQEWAMQEAARPAASYPVPGRR